MTRKECLYYEACEHYNNGDAAGLAENAVETKCPIFKEKSRYIEVPCKAGDYIHFKGLETPWKVSAIHFYAEGAPQISMTSESGKITTTMTFSEFVYNACVITEKGERE